MRRRCLIILAMLPILLFAQTKEEMMKMIGIEGYVEDYITHKPIPGVIAEVLSSDSTVLQKVKTGGAKSVNGVTTMLSRYRLALERGKVYIIRFTFKDYETEYTQLDLRETYKREMYRNVPTVYMMRSMKGKLDEVTVTATKLKFHYKGDTLVYNADAFRLAEGSMLDALIEQLPGAELRTDGQILVNGKKIDALLLNGKDFFRGNNRIMLDNLPNYMVNTINVYDRQSKQSEFLGYSLGDEDYVMDVKLKKQYSIGWIGNAEGGAGTEDRYLGRLFLNRFTNHSQVTLYGNINNLNDNRKPGQSGDWSPDEMRGGLLSTKMAGLNYAIDDRQKRFNLNGEVQFAHTDQNLESHTNRTNFLQNGDTYDWIQQLNDNQSTRISTQHSLYLRGSNMDFTIAPSFHYQRSKHENHFASATFSEGLEHFSKEQLDSVFTPDFGQSLRKILINRNQRQGKGNGSEWNGTIQANSNIKIKHTPDAIGLKGSVTFKGGESDNYNRNLINFYQGGASNTSDFRNMYQHNKPGEGYDYKLGVSYIRGNSFWPRFTFSYQYGQRYDSRSSSLYRLDQLDGWGENSNQEVGLLPSESLYRQALDASNSYDSRQWDHSHEAKMALNYNKQTQKHEWWGQMSLPVTYHDRHMNYHQGKVDTVFSHRTILLNFYDTFMTWKTRDGKHNAGIYYNLHSQAPDMRYLVNVKNDVDPLNISMGNPDLKNSYRHEYTLNYRYSNKKKQSNTNINLTHGINRNAIAMGMIYNKETGVRMTRPENVNGNWDVRAQVSYYTPLDKKKKLTLRNLLEGNYYHNVDLIGVEGVNTSSRSTVETYRLSESLTLKYQSKDVTFGFKGRAVWSNSRSQREDFQAINALDLNYGLTAQCNLPYKWQINTDLTMYTRRGYEDDAMNTDDLVWNIRVSRPFFKNRILLTVDGFDVFGQVSNVTRTLNAQARMETYANVIPSYFLCHLTYRLNVQPKKR